MSLSRHDRKILDWNVKYQHKQIHQSGQIFVQGSQVLRSQIKSLEYTKLSSCLLLNILAITKIDC